MEKFLSYTVILFLIILLTGCGKKSVTCSGDITQDDLTASIQVVGDFDKDKLVNQTIEMKFDLTNYLQYANIDSFYEGFKNQYDRFNEYDGISTKVLKGDKDITIEVSMAFDKIDKDAYKELDLGTGNVEISLSKFIDEFTDMGLTCKR